jgi:hypothetical protein
MTCGGVGGCPPVTRSVDFSALRMPDAPPRRLTDLLGRGPGGRRPGGTEPIDLTVEEYVIRRLSRPDAVDPLVDEDAPRMEELRAKSVALRSRIRFRTDEFADDDDADAAEFKAATCRIKARLADVEAQMAHPQRVGILVDIVTAEDPAKAWKDLTLDRRRAVGETLATVTLLTGRPGRAPFDLRSVRIEPTEQSAQKVRVQRAPSRGAWSAPRQR